MLRKIETQEAKKKKKSEEVKERHGSTKEKIEATSDHG